jgi:serine/threonine-protein kinase
VERFGSYWLERKINVGSIGEVFLARREGEPPDRPVVVKRLHRELARRADHVELFLEEGRTAQRFGHSNLVRAFDAGQVEREHLAGEPEQVVDQYIAMELVRGPNLAQLAARAPVSPAAAVRLALDLSAGLAHMHGEGIVHCDVAPSNVLIGPDRALLTDFGVTNPAGQIQPRVRGTTAYMSPEQARGQPLDGRSDLFSLATILWELLARRPLFGRDAPYLTLIAVVEEPVPDLAGAAPPALEQALRRALAKEPAERWPSISAFAEALTATIQSA